MTQSARALLHAIAAALVMGAAAAVPAQEPFPSRPIHVIVPYPAGGTTDQIARAIQKPMAEFLGQPVVVENKAGAAGSIGVEALVRSAPDGYTVGIIPTGNIAVNPTLFRNLPYKASDLAPVTMLATAENVLVVNQNLPVASLRDLIGLAKAKPGTISFASPGAGSQAHLAGELLALRTGTQLVHVPYKGIAPAVTDLLGGHVSMMFSQVISAIEPIRTGKLKALGVASPKRNALLPQTPTIAEQDLPGFEAVSWYALMVPAATPQAIVDRLQAEVSKILKSRTVTDKLAQLGADTDGGPARALAATIESETARWAEVIRKQNIPLQ